MVIEYELKKVHVRDIIPDKNQPRQKYDLMGILDISGSIKKIGLLNPPIVEIIEGDEEKYKAVIGHRRYFGALIAGEDEIYVKVVKGKLTNVQRLEMQIHEDSQESFHPWVRAENYYDFFNRMKETNANYTFSDFCKKIGRSEGMVRDGFAYASNLSPNLKKAVVDGKLNYNIAVEIAKIRARPDDKESLKDAIYRQEKTAQWVINQKGELSRTKLEEMIARANNEITPKEFKMEAQEHAKEIPRYVENLRAQFYDVSRFLNKVLQFSRIEKDHREKMLGAEYDGKNLPGLLGKLEELGTAFSEKSRKNSSLLDRLSEKSKEKFQDVRDVDFIYKYALEENLKNRAGAAKRDYVPVIESISAELIKPDPKNPRGYFSKEGVEDLANSIKEVGLLNPILINRINGNYQVIVGHRRFAACKLAGLKNIECFVVENLSEEAVREIQLAEDSQEEWKKEERAKAWSSLYDMMSEKEGKLPIEAFSKKIGKSFGTVKKAISFEKMLTGRVKDMYMHELISYSIATHISEQEKKSQYPLALEAAIGDYTTATLRKKIKREKENRHHTEMFAIDPEKTKELCLSKIGRDAAAHVHYLNRSLEDVLEKKKPDAFKDRPAISKFFEMEKYMHGLNRFIKGMNN